MLIDQESIKAAYTDQTAMHTHADTSHVCSCVYNLDPVCAHFTQITGVCITTQRYITYMHTAHRDRHTCMCVRHMPEWVTHAHCATYTNEAYSCCMHGNHMRNTYEHATFMLHVNQSCMHLMKSHVHCCSSILHTQMMCVLTLITGAHMCSLA